MDDSLRCCLLLWNSGFMLRPKTVPITDHQQSMGSGKREEPEPALAMPCGSMEKAWAQWLLITISGKRDTYEIFKNCFSKREWTKRGWEIAAQDCIHSEPCWIRQGWRNRAQDCPQACLLGWGGASSHCEGLLDSGTSHLGEAECTPPLQPPWHRWGSFSASPGGKEKLVNCYQFFPHFYVSSSCLTFDYLIKISKRSLFSLSSIRLHYHSSESLNIKGSKPNVWTLSAAVQTASGNSRQGVKISSKWQAVEVVPIFFLRWSPTGSQD